MLPAVPSVPPGGAGEGGSATAWTGEKRRKTTQPSLGSSDDGTDRMDIQLHEGQGSKRVGEQHPPEDSGFPPFSANDEINGQDLAPFLRKVKSRKPLIFKSFQVKSMPEEEHEELYERFCRLRFQDYCKTSKPDDTNTAGSKYPSVVHDWKDPCRPNHIFDWTIHPDFFFLADLDDYQRVIPTREDFHEYLCWEEYCKTFSNYDTDEDYVKYFDELSKKIKWLEEYLHLDELQFENVDYTGYKQAMKIASHYCHLPYSLAVLGYKEHIWCLRYNCAIQKDDRMYFEIWKRVSKQKMGFIQALEDIHAANLFPSRASVIEAEIKGVIILLKLQFKICMKQIPEHVEDDDKVLEHITYAVYNKFRKPKIYIDYVRKKLEIGRRLHLTLGSQS